MLRMSCNAVSMCCWGCEKGMWSMAQVGESSFFFFALHLVSKNEITCSGLKGFRHPESCVCFCFGEEGENTEVWFGLVYASLRCFHG